MHLPKPYLLGTHAYMVTFSYWESRIIRYKYTYLLCIFSPSRLFQSSIFRPSLIHVVMLDPNIIKQGLFFKVGVIARLYSFSSCMLNAMQFQFMDVIHLPDQEPLQLLWRMHNSWTMQLISFTSLLH